MAGSHQDQALVTLRMPGLWEPLPPLHSPFPPSPFPPSHRFGSRALGGVVGLEHGAEAPAHLLTLAIAHEETVQLHEHPATGGVRGTGLPTRSSRFERLD